MSSNNFDFSQCTSVLVGKKATADGSTMIARNEDYRAAWPKHMVVHPHEEFATEQEFVAVDNKFTMMLPKVKGKYTATPEWTPKYGLIEEAGINEYGVAMSATESTYANQRVLAYDPLVENGLNEGAMITVVLPYIKSAREGVAMLGKIVEEHGAAETNGVLFSDEEEVWYLEIGCGHHWVAQRIPDDAYAVVANQMAIQEIDFADDANFMFSPGIVDFVTENHLQVAESGFNFRNIFGTHELSDEIYSTPRVWYGQRFLNPSIEQDPMSEELPFLRKAERLIHLDDVAYILGSHYQNTPYDPLGNGAEKNKFRPISLAKTQESHILQIKPNLPIEIGGVHWMALGVTAQSVFVPFFSGATDVHPAYKVGQQTYSPDSAYWVYKLVGVLVDPHYRKLGDDLKGVQKELNSEFAGMVAKYTKEAQALSGTALTEFLTTSSIAMQQHGLDKMRKLSGELITKSTDFSPLNFSHDENL
ncbi:C69 family dipeptidase [Ligilactobacillus ceti]|uniref:Dipeptidase n=1 Tax=Ligilactobacillus ceti DSM 22408 TaxID=1122146 RepID=A0A0R2KPA0_9LACO|nr:C69 family dipeptidase [Ligilactobacillus ceti]KRN88780.1 dipeptidase A [Ligilactobacillus ceti DSM 22408]